MEELYVSLRQYRWRFLHDTRLVLNTVSQWAWNRALGVLNLSARRDRDGDVDEEGRRPR